MEINTENGAVLNATSHWASMHVMRVLITVVTAFIDSTFKAVSLFY